MATWTPRRGQWVRFDADLPASILARHEEGHPKIHKLESGDFLGKYALAKSRAQIGTLNDVAIYDDALPARIILTDEHGSDVVGLRDNIIRTLFVTMEDIPGCLQEEARRLGWTGVVKAAAPGKLADLPPSYCVRTWPSREGETTPREGVATHLAWCPHEELAP